VSVAMTFSDGRATEEQFDVIFLFDVLEHITEEDRFLRALAFYLAPGESW